MSSIPPPTWIAALAQSSAAQKRAGDARQQAESTQQDVHDPHFAEKLRQSLGAVDTVDASGELSPDAQQGGQGRAFSHSQNPSEHPDSDADQSPPPPGGLDLTA